MVESSVTGPDQLFVVWVANFRANFRPAKRWPLYPRGSFGPRPDEASTRQPANPRVLAYCSLLNAINQGNGRVGTIRPRRGPRALDDSVTAAPRRPKRIGPHCEEPAASPGPRTECPLPGPSAVSWSWYMLFNPGPSACPGCLVLRSYRAGGLCFRSVCLYGKLLHTRRKFGGKKDSLPVRRPRPLSGQKQSFEFFCRFLCSDLATTPHVPAAGGAEVVGG